MRAGLDIGGTKIDAVAVDDSGRPVETLRLATGFGAAQVLSNAVLAVEQLTTATGVGFDSIGVGIPGLVDPVTGTVRHAVNLGFDDFEFGRSLELALQHARPVMVPDRGASSGSDAAAAEPDAAGAHAHAGADARARADATRVARAPRRVSVENDVNAAALGAYHLMQLSGPVAYLNLGTGLAAGLVVDGALWRGARGVSGEIGHIPVDPQGLDCPCGQRGCLETVASGSAIARRWPSAHDYPAQALFAAAAAGDETATRIRHDLAAGVAAAIRMLVLTVDVETVVIGGGLSHVGAPLLAAVEEVLAGWAAQSTFLASLALPSRLRLLPDGLPVAAVGAAMVGAASAAAVPANA